MQCEYALESRADPSGCRDALAVVDRQNKRMSTLIEDMLILTRLDRSLEKRVFESVDLSVQVESVCADMAISAPAGITVQCDAEPNVVVSGDANLLHRLVANLVGNACKYGKDGGHVVVSLVAVAGDAESDSAHGEDTAAGAAVSPARLAGGVSPGGSTADGSTSSTTDPPSDHCGKRAEPHALLTVRDDGIGISEKDCRRIFDRFYQADSSRSNTGSGLGLSIVAEIARIHKGRVHVESVLGKGSSFSVVLPLARAREAP